MAFDVMRSVNHCPELSGGVQKIPMIATITREKRIAMRRIDLIIFSFELWVGSFERWFRRDVRGRIGHIAGVDGTRVRLVYPRNLYIRCIWKLFPWSRLDAVSDECFLFEG